MVGPVLTSVAPYHLRGLTGAVGAIYLFFFGATGGAVLSAGLDQAFGPRAAVLIVMIPTTIIGGFMIIRGSHFIRNDLSLVVLELQEEQEEHQRQEADPESIPVMQLNNVDFSYGHVQVLFDVAFEVRRGEVLALLGTNGAGKSTALKVAAGLVTADRGVVRLNGRTVTYATPGAAVAPRDPPPSRRPGCLRGDDHQGEPRDGRLRLPGRPGGAATTDGAGPGHVPGPRVGTEPAAPTRSPAVSSRCWRSPSRCCTTRRCS